MIVNVLDVNTITSARGARCERVEEVCKRLLKVCRVVLQYTTAATTRQVALE